VSAAPGNDDDESVVVVTDDKVSVVLIFNRSLCYTDYYVQDDRRRDRLSFR